MAEINYLIVEQALERLPSSVGDESRLRAYDFYHRYHEDLRSLPSELQSLFIREFITNRYVVPEPLVVLGCPLSVDLH